MSQSNKITKTDGTKKLIELILGKSSNKEDPMEEIDESAVKEISNNVFGNSETPSDPILSEYEGFIDGQNVVLTKHVSGPTNVEVASSYSVNGDEYSTKLTNNSSNLFTRDNAVKNITFSEGIDTSELTDMSGMFKDCTNLETVDLTNFDNSNVTTMESTFENCTSLSRVSVSDTWKEEGIDMTNTFNNAGVSSVDTGSDLAGITPIGYFETIFVRILGSSIPNDGGLLITGIMPGFTGSTLRIASQYEYNGEIYKTILGGGYSLFGRSITSSGFNEVIIDDGVILAANCSSLFCASQTTLSGHVTRISIGKVTTGARIGATNSTIDISNDSSMYKMFYNQRNSLTIIEGLENLDTSAVTDMGCMFQNCSGLTNLDLTTFDTSACTSMYQMFYGCTELTEALVTRGLWVTEQADTTDMFTGAGCYKVTYYGESPEIPSQFVTPPLSDFTFSKNTSTNEVYLNCYNGNDEYITIPATYDGFSTVISYNGSSTKGIFQAKPSLIQVKIEDGVRIITSKSNCNMFYQCTNLQSVEFGDVDTSTIYLMKNMFNGCTSLTEIKGLTNFSTINVTDMSNMFYGCSSLTSLDLTSFNTSKVRYFTGIFQGCTNMQEIKVSGTWNTGAASSSNKKNMFLDCGVSGVTVV